MSRVDAKFQQIGSLLIVDREMEQMPDPYRLQSNLKIEIRLKEYIKFIELELESYNFLASPTRYLKDLITKGDIREISACFMQDVAFAIAKEVSFAEEYNKETTKIRPVFDVSEIQVNTLSMEEMAAVFKTCSAVTEQLLREPLMYKGFSIPNTFGGTRWIEWQYANVLYFYSLTKSNFVLINF